jgi:hypothetical protein
LLPKEEFEIMDYELEYLLKAVKEFKQATPRSIRIFYYRYLLAKHFKEIIIRKESTVFSEWVVYNQKELLCYMIVDYSSSQNQEQLLDELVRTSNEKLDRVTKLFLGREFTVSRELYFALLKVVEIVVPY